MTSIYTDTAIIEDIKSGGVKRQRAITHIYQEKELKNQIIALVTKNSGSRDEGIEIFHEGIIALDENIRKGKYEEKGKLRGYLYTLCRFLWLNKIKRSSKTTYTSELNQLDEVNFETPESLSMSNEQKDILGQLLSRLGEKCEKILELWKLSYSMEEIADQVGLGNAGIARRQRYRCYQKLMKLLEEEPNLKNSLI